MAVPSCPPCPAFTVTLSGATPSSVPRARDLRAGYSKAVSILVSFAPRVLDQASPTKAFELLALTKSELSSITVLYHSLSTITNYLDDFYVVLRSRR